MTSVHADDRGTMSPHSDGAGQLAPYAVVRLAAEPYPSASPAAMAFGEKLAVLVNQELTVARIAAQLVDVLHDSAADHAIDFHQQVVLPLRRDVYNGRTPRPALLTALRPLVDRVPLLAAWLAARAELTACTEAVESTWPGALAAERATLATLCAGEPLRKACVLTSRDLLHGLDRTVAGAGNPDRKARKVEATVLRYALRATTKTSPLSWFTSVGWGLWTPADEQGRIGGDPIAAAELNQVPLARLLHALLADPARRQCFPHRLAPDLREDGDRIRFRRDIPAAGARRAFITKEEAVDIAGSAPLRFLLAEVRSAGATGRTPIELITALAVKLPAERAVEAATAYLDRVLDIGLLVPVRPIDPQHPHPVEALAGWLTAHGAGDIAEQLCSLAATISVFATASAADRVPALAELESGWRRLGAATGTDLTEMPPLTEDVVLREPARLGTEHGRDAVDALAELTPLLLVFDRNLLVRRLVRNDFVARFGVGGTADLAVCTDLLDAAWQRAMTDPARDADEHIRAFLRLQEHLNSDIVDCQPRAALDRTLPEEVVSKAATLLPGWLRTRPASYSFFLQPLAGATGTQLVLNHIYAGFGKFTSRFLDRFGGRAHVVVADQLREVFGPDGFVQFRPVAGFNANLHPLMGDREVGEDARWSDLTTDDLVLRHDPTTDEVRLYERETSRPLDVAYLGFLLPSLLPDRFSALYSDLACGWAELDHLRATEVRAGVTISGRLSYRDIVLSRRSWTFDAATSSRLRAEVDVDGPAAAVAIARLRARYGLPAQVFVSSGRPITSREDFERRMTDPKPQYLDLDNALHLRCLHRTLARYPEELMVTEALPVPGQQGGDGRVLELIAESYWRAS